MPGIPVPQLPSIGLAPIPGVRATPDAFGANGPRVDLSEPLDEAKRAYDTALVQANQARVLDASAEIARWSTDMLSGLRKQQGANALPALDKMVSDWHENVQATEEGLSNAEQKLAFRNIAQQHFQSLYAQGVHHVDQQQAQVETEAFNKAVFGQQHLAVKAVDEHGNLSPAGEVAIQQSVDSLRAVYAHAKESGWATDADEAKAVSDLHAGVLQNLLSGGTITEAPHQAINYFKAHADEMTDAARSKMDALVSKRTAEGLAHGEADRIWGQHITLDAAMREAEKIQDPKVRDLIKTEIRNKASDEAQSRNRDERQAYDEATQRVTKGESWFSLPVDLRARMSATQQEAVSRLASHIRNPVRVTDTKTLATLDNLASLHPDQFVNTDLNKYADKLSESRFAQLLDKQARIRKEQGKAKPRAAPNTPADTGSLVDWLNAATPQLKAPGGPSKRTSKIPDGKKTSSISSEWLDHAATDDAYAQYLRDMGVSS